MCGCMYVVFMILFYYLSAARRDMVALLCAILALNERFVGQLEINSTKFSHWLRNANISF